jgi:hypothetical protein
LNPTTPSAGAGAAAQVPTQCPSFGKAALHSNVLLSDSAAVVASTATDFEAAAENSGGDTDNTKFTASRHADDAAKQYGGDPGRTLANYSGNDSAAAHVLVDRRKRGDTQ